MSPARSEEGTSLIEILIAIAILGIAVTAVLGALATGIDMSAVDRTHAEAQAALRSNAEAIQAAAFDPCPADYSTATLAVPAGWTIDVSDIEYWVAGSNPAEFSTTCPLPVTDDLAQRITITLHTDDSRVGALGLQVVKRAEGS